MQVTIERYDGRHWRHVSSHDIMGRDQFRKVYGLVRAAGKRFPAPAYDPPGIWRDHRDGVTRLYAGSVIAEVDAAWVE